MAAAAAATNLQSRRLATWGKKFLSQIRSPHQPLILIRSVHNSAYDKNPEEQVNSTVVSDDMNPPKPEQYWAPDPKTGVFGPASDQNSAGKYGFQASASEESVLEQKTFFRPLEDLDKPDHA